MTDPAGGNRFAGVNLAAPIGVADPEVRIKNIRSQMTRKREERAIDMVGAIAPVLSLLPDSVLESMAGSIVNSDVQASNVPVYAGDTFIAGAKILRQYGLGPLPGVAMMVVLMSRAGYCTITTRYDRASITDAELFARCLLAGFDEVLALGGDGRSMPASFTLDTVRTQSSRHPTGVRRNDFAKRPDETTRQSADHAAAGLGRRDRGQPARARGRRVLRPRRHPGRRVHRRRS